VLYLQAFYVIHGRGRTETGLGVVEWNTGDLFAVPSNKEEMPCTHTCLEDDVANTGGAGLYWVSDAPLLSYLGVVPKVKKFEPSFFR
jgi:gentisate 1,2-dioxygenase